MPVLGAHFSQIGRFGGSDGGSGRYTPLIFRDQKRVNGKQIRENYPKSAYAPVFRVVVHKISPRTFEKNGEANLVAQA